MHAPPDPTAARRTLMGILARAKTAHLAACLDTLAPLPAFEELRAPQSGLVMLRGRMAGSGAPFNLGEASVTRAAVRLASGETGFSYCLGRDHSKARMAAQVDALFQHPAWCTRIAEHVLTPLAQDLATQDNVAQQEAAATRVDFFTLVRGDP